jgi:hypothetical protein
METASQAALKFGSGYGVIYNCAEYLTLPISGRLKTGCPLGRRRVTSFRADIRIV